MVRFKSIMQNIYSCTECMCVCVCVNLKKGNLLPIIIQVCTGCIRILFCRGVTPP